MGTKSIPVLLVTANVGSIFEDPSEMLKIWTQEFLSTVAKLDPKFIALHCQEVGGKNYEKSMKHVEDFVTLLMSSNELRLFDKIRVFLDEDYSSAEHFTALGNFYFIHESMQDVLIWNFKDIKFVPVNGKEIHSGNIEAVVTKEKAKFPQDFFPECKWSRKGFLRTRWSIRGTVFDLVNIHLFHDASNFVAMESYPSVYCRNRRRALEHTLQRFHNDSYGRAPHFLFGDFNFRTDTESVINKLTEGLITTRIQNNKNTDYTKFQYTDDKDKLILTIGKKEFKHSDHQGVFLNATDAWLKVFDKELEAFGDHLIEFPVTFPPSYPFEEKITQAESYMQTRCPAWCDRVLLSHTARKLVIETENVEYGLIGLSTCMGDHKPVYLKANILPQTGIIKCCIHLPYECLPVTCPCCQSFASVTINVTDMSDYLINTRKSFDNVTVDSRLLHEPITKDMLSHDPYTPESAESHSPNPERTGTETRISISPAQLKRRLESILNVENAPSTKSFQRLEVNSPTQFYRGRAMSELPRTRKPSRARLNTSASVSLRLNSHHSSSDEEWFEFDSTDTKNTSSDSSVIDVPAEPRLENILEESSRITANKSTHNKITCCCIL